MEKTESCIWRPPGLPTEQVPGGKGIPKRKVMHFLSKCLRKHAFAPVSSVNCPFTQFLPPDTSLGHWANGVLKAYFIYLGDLCSPWERELQSTRERSHKESLGPLLPVNMYNPTTQPFSWPKAWNPKSFLLNVISLLWSCVSRCWKMAYLKNDLPQKQFLSGIGN